MSTFPYGSLYTKSFEGKLIIELFTFLGFDHLFKCLINNFISLSRNPISEV
jgi:hypothetical protein